MRQVCPNNPVNSGLLQPQTETTTGIKRAGSLADTDIWKESCLPRYTFEDVEKWHNEHPLFVRYGPKLSRPAAVEPGPEPEK